MNIQSKYQVLNLTIFMIKIQSINFFHLRPVGQSKAIDFNYFSKLVAFQHGNQNKLVLSNIGKVSLQMRNFENH